MRTRAVAGLAVTELGFGGASIGNLWRETSDEEAAGAIEAAWDGGVRYFDTAPHYGLGLSERRLGATLNTKPRNEYLLSTKVGRILEPNPAPTGSDVRNGGFLVPDTLTRRADFSRDGVRRSVDDSLARLGMDRIDIVFVHDPDDHVDAAIEHAIPALIELREQGVIGAVGVGMNQWEAPLRMSRETDLDVVMLAGRWTLLDRSGAELIAERGVTTIAAAPFNSGLLAGDRPKPDANFNYRPVSAELFKKATGLADICERDGTHLPDAALQFPLRSPQVASVVCGMRTAAQVRNSLARMASEIGESTWKALEC